MRALAAKSILLISLLTFTFACKQKNQNNSILEGNLYFGYFRFGSFYNQPDSIIKEVRIYFDTVNVKYMSISDKRELAMYKSLNRENLLFKPFIELRVNNNSIIKVYLDSLDYDKIKVYKRENLQENGKVLRIKMESLDLGNNMAYCTKLISLKEMDGKTLMNERKFKIEDYK